MEALRGYLPNQDYNYWLKFGTATDAQVSMSSLLAKIRVSFDTIICIQTMNGSVFGSFTRSPWRLRKHWYGDLNDGSFLFRCLEGKMQVYPNTGNGNHVQYCTPHVLAVGGGDWQKNSDEFPFYAGEESQGIGLLIDGDLSGGESNSCSTFANPRLFQGVNGNEFTVDKMEVWTLTPCGDIKQAERREFCQSFAD